MRALQLKS